MLSVSSGTDCFCLEVVVSVGSGFRVDSNRSGKMQSGRVESRAVLTLVILTG